MTASGAKTETTPGPRDRGLFRACMTLCRTHVEAARPAQHKVHAGLPREEQCGLLFRLRGRPPAPEQRGRSPSTRARLASESGRRREARTALTAARRGWVAVRKAHQQSTTHATTLLG